MHKSDNFSTKHKNYVDSHNEAYAWILFLIAPIIVFIIALKNFKNKSLRKFIVLFGGLYGLFFIPIPDSDATRFQDIYANLNNYNFNAYWYDISNIASPDNRFQDVYAYTVFFLGKMFSDNPQVFYLITALVYFYVFVILLGYIYDNNVDILKKKQGLFFLGIVFLFGFSSGINGVRWPLGLLVFLLGTVQLLTLHNIKYLFLAALSILIHFSFYPAVLALCAFYYIPFLRKPNILIGLAIAALLASTVLSNIIFSNAAIFGEVAQNKLTDYTAEGYVETREADVSSWNFYVAIYRFGTYYFAVGALAIMWIKQKQMITNRNTNQLFSFALLMATISFVSSAIVDLSTNRYFVIVSFFTLIYLINIIKLNENKKVFKTLAFSYSPILILSMLLGIRVEWETVDIISLASPILAFLI